MGVITAAEEALNRAEVYINSAIKEITDVAVGNEWGYEDYSDAYKEKLFEAAAKLMNIKHELF